MKASLLILFQSKSKTNNRLFYERKKKILLFDDFKFLYKLTQSD